MNGEERAALLAEIADGGRGALKAEIDRLSRERASRTRRVERSLEEQTLEIAGVDLDRAVAEITPPGWTPHAEPENGAPPEDPVSVGTEAARERIVAAMVRWYAERGRWPTSTEWQRPDRPAWAPNYDAVRGAFPGGWREAIAAAGGDDDGAPARPTPEPDAKPNPPIPMPDVESSLVELARRLEAADESKREADAAYDEALLAFREHKLFAAALDDMP